MKRPETVLVILLRVAAVILLSALVAVVMPFPWMEDIHARLGMGELPDRPIVGYLARSCSLFYAMHGALLFFVSLDVPRFLPVIRFLGWLGVVFGVVIVPLDAAAGMPLWWTLGEGPFPLALGVAVLWLAKRCAKGAATRA